MTNRAAGDHKHCPRCGLTLTLSFTCPYCQDQKTWYATDFYDINYCRMCGKRVAETPEMHEALATRKKILCGD